MLTSFTLKNFRCFQEFSISPLKRINLITGMNNVGKTALLEGAFLFAGAANPSLTFNVNIFRGLGVFEISSDLQDITPWYNLFFNFDETKEIILNGVDADLSKQTLRIRVKRKTAPITQTENVSVFTDVTGLMQCLEYDYINKEGKHVESEMSITDKGAIASPFVASKNPYSTIFLPSKGRPRLNEESDRFSNILRNQQEDILLDALKIVEPRLSQLKLLTTAGISVIHGNLVNGKQPYPLAIMGEGLVKVCSIVLAIANAPNGIIFIDEIENGIHYSVMDKFWGSVYETAKRFDVQIFATTHSRECAVSAHNTFKRLRTDDFLFCRLDKINNKIEAKIYSEEILDAAIDSDLEIR